MNRQEAEKIKPELKKCFDDFREYQNIKVKNTWFDVWFDETYPPEPEYIPFEWKDWKLFMGENVKRRGEVFKNEIWMICGLNNHSVYKSLDQEHEWMCYEHMLDEWEFSDGRPFGKLKM